MKKAIVVGISLLCIITILISSLAVTIAKASNDTHITEVTLQVYGVKEFGDTTVQLTEQQYRTLRNYLKTFQERLNQTTTREEALTLFREAIVEMDTYGLLPKKITVDQTFSMISGGRTDLMMKNSLKIKQTLLSTHSDTPTDVINLFCYFYAHTAYACEDNIWVFLSFLLMRGSYKYDMNILRLLASLIYVYGEAKPLRFMNHIWVPGPTVPGVTYSYFTIGLLGIQRGADEFGDAHGFSGIKLILDGESEAIYIGYTVLTRKNPHYLS